MAHPLRNAWKGETVVCLGNGMSINDHPPEAIKKFRTIGCNDICRAFYPDFFVVCDPPKYFRENACAPDGKSLEWAGKGIQNCPDTAFRADGFEEPWLEYSKRQLDGAHIRFFSIMRVIGWQNYIPDDYRHVRDAWDANDFLRLPYAPGSTGMCVQLALFLGAGRIGVLGLDYTPGHFYNPKSKFPMGKMSKSITQMHFQKFSVMTREVFDVEMFCLSKKSDIQTPRFPYLPLEEL